MQNTCKKDCANGVTKETCPKRKLENERIVLGVLLVASIMYILVYVSS